MEEHLNDVCNNQAWATLKLPEILMGYTEQDHRRVTKAKQQQYKQALDQIQQQPSDIFEGMSD